MNDIQTRAMRKLAFFGQPADQHPGVGSEVNPMMAGMGGAALGGLAGMGAGGGGMMGTMLGAGGAALGGYMGYQGAQGMNALGGYNQAQDEGDMMMANATMQSAQMGMQSDMMQNQAIQEQGQVINEIINYLSPQPQQDPMMAQDPNMGAYAPEPAQQVAQGPQNNGLGKQSSAINSMIEDIIRSVK